MMRNPVMTAERRRGRAVRPARGCRTERLGASECTTTVQDNRPVQVDGQKDG
jgi:hypothetical protein